MSFIILLQKYKFSGKPADIMNTFDVDWRPCLLLGHNRIDIKALEAAQEKYERTKARRQRMDEANSVASAETSTQCDDPNSKEVQTDTKTFCDAETQTEDDDFFSEKKFVSDKDKVHYYTGLTNGEILTDTFEFVMKFNAAGNSRSRYWIFFLIVLLKLRLNLEFQDLAYRMDLSVATMSRRFYEALEIMAI